MPAQDGNLSAATIDRRILDKAGDEQAFREAIRTWLADVVERRAALDEREEQNFYHTQQWWMAERNKVGLATPHWPIEYGGADMGLANQVILAEEMARGGAPAMSLFTVSLHHVPATLRMWGTDAQKLKYLPQVARGEVWCQGFSEPNAGSDLASLRTRAVRDGDHYIVNGQKVWSSFSMYASHCILLARTDPDAQKHRGITYFIMDMNSPGVEVRPIRQSNGVAEFAELFLSDVRIPIENRVGEEGEGWQVAQSTLSAERGVLSFEAGERLRYEIEAFYATSLKDGAPWLGDPSLRREFMRILGEVQACRRLLRRILRQAGSASPELAATIPQVKVINTSLRKTVGEFLVRTQGLSGQLVQAEGSKPAQPTFTYISSFGSTIAGGTNEVMRNLIAERVLGMPKG